MAVNYRIENGGWKMKIGKIGKIAKMENGKHFKYDSIYIFASRYDSLLSKSNIYVVRDQQQFFALSFASFKLISGCF